MIDPTLNGATGRSVWDLARLEYLSGVKASSICQRYGMSLSSFRAHARSGGWRRIDRPDCDAVPEDGEFHPDDNVSFADLADQTFLNIRRAIATGRAGEAASWMRLFDKLAERGRPEIMADLPDLDLPVDPSAEPLLRLAASDPTDRVSAPTEADRDATAKIARDAGPARGSDPACDPEPTSGPCSDLDSGLDSDLDSWPSTHDTTEPSKTLSSQGFDPEASPELDSLDSGFPESNTPPEPAVAPDRDREGILLLRSRRLDMGMSVHDLDALLEGLSP